MKFPNAYKGISKILTAQWISLISTVLMIVGTVAVLLTANSANAADLDSISAAAGIGVIVFLVAGIIGIIALILELVGLNSARKDEVNFKYALIVCVISLILFGVSVALQSVNPTVSGWLSFAYYIFSLCAIEYAVAGVISLAEKTNNPQIADFGRKIRIIITVLYIVALVGNIFNLVKAATTLGTIFSIVYLVLNVIVFILYIVILSKAKKMLSE